MNKILTFNMAAKLLSSTVEKQFQRLMSNKERDIKSKECSWIFDGKWIRAGCIHYSLKGETRVWETVERTTRKGTVDAVDIIATQKDKDRILLVAVYRPPINKICVEFPSGLIDKNEEPSEAGERELREETGHEGKVENISVPVYCDPWKSTENTILVQMSITDDAGKQSLDDDEYIEAFYLSLQNLLKSLQNLKEKFDIEIESKLYLFALGLENGKTLLK